MSIIQFLIGYVGYYLKAQTKFDVHSPFVYEFIENILSGKINPSDKKNIRLFLNELENNPTLIETFNLGALSHFNYSQKKSIAQIYNQTGFSKKYSRLLFHYVRHFQPQNILELGTGLGVSTFFMAQAQSQGNILSVEGNFDLYQITKANFQKFKMNNVKFLHLNFDDFFAHLDTHLPTPIQMIFIDGNHQYKSTIRYFKILKNYCTDSCVFIFDDIRWSKEMSSAWQEISSDKDINVSIDLYKIGMAFIKKEIKVKQHFVLRY